VSNPNETFSLTAPTNKQRDANRLISFSLAGMSGSVARSEAQDVDCAVDAGRSGKSSVSR